MHSKNPHQQAQQQTPPSLILDFMTRLIQEEPEAVRLLSEEFAARLTSEQANEKHTALLALLRASPHF
jgi:hypothetical protein